MILPRTGKLMQLLFLTLIAFSIPTRSCSTAGPSAQDDRTENSNSVPSIAPSADSLNQEAAQEPVSIAAPEREALKREGPELRKKAVYRLPRPVYTSEPAALSPESEEKFSRASVGLNQIEAEAELPDSAQRSAFVNKHSKKKQVRDFKRRSNDDLMSLEYAYRAALLNLFNNSFADGDRLPNVGPDGNFGESLFAGDDLLGDHNPFEEALLSQEMAGAQQSAGIASDFASQDNRPPQDLEPPSQPQVLASLRTPIGEDVEGPFDFLLIGELFENSERRVFRALRERDGSFTLDNSTRFPLPSRGFLVFQENEKVLYTELNRDGVPDLVVVRQASSGSQIEIFVGQGGTQFQKSTSIFVPQKVIGVGVLELSGDREEDLVLLFEGVPHLVIYERVGDQFRYVKELVVPFTPGLLTESQEDGGSRRLHIFNSSATEVISLGGENGGVFVSRTNSILDHLRVVRLDSLAGSEAPVELLVLEYGRTITLAERTSAGVVFYASFSAGEKVPMVIVGDYFLPGTRQLLLGP